MAMQISTFGLLVISLLFPLPLFGQDASVSSEDEAAIRTAVHNYVTAFNRQDSKAIAAAWSEAAVYTNRITGEKTIGREAIEAQFVELFEERNDLQLEVSVESIQFVSPNVAVEQGTANFLDPGEDSTSVRYSSVYIRHDGQWLLDRVTDESNQRGPTRHDPLRELEFLIGSWIDEDDQVNIRTECKWAKNHSFITRTFTAFIDGELDISGIQIIGWDTAAEAIRSWTFDSDGGFSEGAWTKSGNRWFVRKTGTLADGRKASAVNIITPLDDDAITTQSVQRALGAKMLPNIDEVRIVRQ